MAKSKSKSVKEVEQAAEVKNTPVFTPVNKKYKPIPKFNGKCKDC